MPPDPPSYARPRNMIRSEFKLDPPLLTVLFIVGRTTLFTPVDINLEQVVDFLNFTRVSIR